jgi:hypothetical protein
MNFLKRQALAPVVLTRRKIYYLSDIKLPDKSSYSMGRDGATQTMLKNTNCRLRLILWLNGWYLPEKEYKMSWGSMFHELLDKTYTLHKVRKILPSRQLMESWADLYYVNLRKSLPDFEPVKQELDMVKALVILRNYLLAYKEDFTEQKSTIVESVFAVPFEGFLLRGKIDREYIKGIFTWLMEHKTKGKIIEGSLLDLLGINFQNMYYSFAHLLEKGSCYKGIDYNIIRNSSSKPSERSKESLQTFEERFEADVKKRPDHYFKRYALTFNHDKEIEKFSCDLLCRLKETEQLLDGKLPIYANTFACEDPWPCPYIRACSSGVLTGYRQKKLFEELEEEI